MNAQGVGVLPAQRTRECGTGYSLTTSKAAGMIIYLVTMRRKLRRRHADLFIEHMKDHLVYAPGLAQRTLGIVRKC